MAGNSFGEIFRLTTFGESHGAGVGGVIDGCPPGFKLDLKAIQAELNRRKPGQSNLTTSRKESDTFEILSGLFEGKTTGAPLAFLIRNSDQRSQDYDHLKNVYRPSHADFSWQSKFGFRDYRGGGRSSARETVARVFAGAVARQFLATQNIRILAYVAQIGAVKMIKFEEQYDQEQIEASIVRCPDKQLSSKMEALILATKDLGDTLGGIIHGSILGLPAGLGEPVFDKFHADLGKAMLSINAVKGFEYGSGFEAARMSGKEHNDVFVQDDEKLTTKTNFSGGIQGGITNGAEVYFNVAFKPVATVMQQQQTVDVTGKTVKLEGKGRHDVTVVPRAVPIVEAMAALVCLDHLLRQQTNKFLSL
ncbi:MAG: chorismate synthase [Bacteroidales bacterium]|jgi:chorismate synthase|nr:chorismate synthase [Bacteroidales bacterium]MDD4086611.1 chorismate synthase [Bacteroidales bacterium]MDY0085771.1 chorismate synthase [Bacteroidales bacterium]